MTFWLIFVSVLKWQLFLKSLDLPANFWSLYQFYIIGYFFGNFLPSNIGGDAVRLTLTAKGKGTYTRSFVAVFMERFTGIVVTVLFVAVSLPFVLWYFKFMDNVVLVMFPTIFIVAMIAGLFLIRPEILNSWNPKSLLLKRVCAKLTEILLLINSFRSHNRVLLKAMLLSIVFNLLAIVNVYVVAKALDFSIDLFSLFMLVPMILVISAIPLSINAIGIAEGAYVLCLSQVGLSAPAALSIALLIRAKSLIVSLFGGILFIVYRKQHDIKIPMKSEPPEKHAIP